MATIFAGMFVASPSNAQDATSVATPYGQQPGEYATPFETRRRDPNGTRIIVNGRIVDAGETNDRPQGLASNFSAGVSRSGRTLRSSTLSAVSIGNNVTVNGVTNSVVNVRQSNYGRQAAVIGAGG